MRSRIDFIQKLRCAHRASQTLDGVCHISVHRRDLTHVLRTHLSFVATASARLSTAEEHKAMNREVDNTKTGGGALSSGQLLTAEMRQIMDAGISEYIELSGAPRQAAMQKIWHQVWSLAHPTWDWDGMSTKEKREEHEQWRELAAVYRSTQKVRIWV